MVGDGIRFRHDRSTATQISLAIQQAPHRDSNHLQCFVRFSGFRTCKTRRAAANGKRVQVTKTEMEPNLESSERGLNDTPASNSGPVKSEPANSESVNSESIVGAISDNAMRVLEMPTRQVRVWHNRIVAFGSKHSLNVITFGLLLSSLFFYASIQPVRNRALASNPELFKDGQMVLVSKVIDGDELRIENDAGSTRMRLLGIQSFDASANDFRISEIGKVCVDYLESNYVGQQVRLEISPKGIDDDGRLLGTLWIPGDTPGEPETDLVLDLVAKGMTLVYLKYDFAEIENYKQVQETARIDKQGLWASERVSTRAASMLRLWEQERKERERKEQERTATQQETEQ